MDCWACGKNPCTCLTASDEKLRLSFETGAIGFDATMDLLAGAQENGYQATLSGDGNKLQVKGVSQSDLPGIAGYLQSKFGIKVRFK